MDTQTELVEPQLFDHDNGSSISDDRERTKVVPTEPVEEVHEEVQNDTVSLIH